MIELVQETEEEMIEQILTLRNYNLVHVNGLIMKKDSVS